MKAIISAKRRPPVSTRSPGARGVSSKRRGDPGFREGLLTGRRATVDTPFLIIAFIAVGLVLLAFFVRFGSMVEESPGERVATQMVYGQVSEVDLRQILLDAYVKASYEEASVNGTSMIGLDDRFSSYATMWIQEYFRKRGVHGVGVNITRGVVAAEEPESYGSGTTMRFGDYIVTIAPGGAGTGGGGAITKVVYYDTSYPAGGWIGADAQTYRDYLVSNGFTALDAGQLRDYMQSHGANTVVVMAQDVVPDTVAASESSNVLIREYMERGGTVVWFGDVPFYYQGHSDGSSTGWGCSGGSTILGITQSDYCTDWDTDTAQITPEGSARGLQTSWDGYRPVSSSEVTTVLADDGSGHAEAWHKNFDTSHPDSGFVRIWDVNVDGSFASQPFLDELVAVSSP